MNFFLSGYYGYDNAGDEAVLAAILEAIGQRVPQATFTVTAGDQATTQARYNSSSCPVRAIPRQNPRSLVPAIRACDVFISGGGSLLQDVTSLRNVVYYTSLIRFARLSRKPVMIYAQGVGPLRKPLSQKLARAAMQSARVVTVRDEASKALLRRIGVRRNVEVTADPVWALKVGEGTSASSTRPDGPVWCISLRSWLGPESNGHERLGQLTGAIGKAAQERGARLRFLPMQTATDGPLTQELLAALPPAVPHELMPVQGMHPRDIMRHAGQCDLMIALRLHALIFAAAQRVPCVAINYDPKVEALAKLIDAPMLRDLSEGEIAKLPDAIATAPPLSAERLATFQNAALHNAELAVKL